MDKDLIKDKLLEDSKKIVLSKDLTATKARFLKDLKYDLMRLKVFKPLKKGGLVIGLDITEYKKIRNYPLNDTLTPYLGYVNYDKDGEPYGEYGLEKYYNNLLTNSSDKIIVGQRDRQGIIIRDKKNHQIKKENGFDIITNITLSLQKKVEKILDKQKEKLGAKEIICAVMESKSGKIITIASSRRYNPLHRENLEILNISAIRYAYEPGSVIKPIFFSILLENKKLNIDEIINTHNGRYKLSNGKIVTDEHKYPFLTAQDVIVHSSNIGMSVLSKRSNPLMLIDGFEKFGFSKPSGIDLSYELTGSIPNITDLKNSVILANLSYGYNIRATFMQLLKAYNVFNNNGKSITPKIANTKVTTKGKYELIEPIKTTRVLSEQTANTMNKILQSVVNKGTGKFTKIPGLTIGGKTGTAQIAYKGYYTKSYNSSFFGFANDKKGHKYTIGVLVIEPNPQGYIHFASQSAVPTFKMIVEKMVEEGLLIKSNLP
jgi:cell division protein FtsI (penicillin-binding protein 3)